MPQQKNTPEQFVRSIKSTLEGVLEGQVRLVTLHGLCVKRIEDLESRCEELETENAVLSTKTDELKDELKDRIADLEGRADDIDDGMDTLSAVLTKMNECLIQVAAEQSIVTSNQEPIRAAISRLNGQMGN